jgi:C-terminal four TMM region of protein-O-mannosyltransferase
MAQAPKRHREYSLCSILRSLTWVLITELLGQRPSSDLSDRQSGRVVAQFISCACICHRPRSSHSQGKEGLQRFRQQYERTYLHVIWRLTLCPAKTVKYDTLCGFLFIGWSLHYFPFWLMGRQLFLHHYFPALYFAILLLCSVFDFLTSTLRPRIRLQIAAILIIIAIWNFTYLSPLAYGNPWTKDKCNSARWLKTWDFSW